MLNPSRIPETQPMSTHKFIKTSMAQSGLCAAPNEPSAPRPACLAGRSVGSLRETILCIIVGTLVCAYWRWRTYTRSPANSFFFLPAEPPRGRRRRDVGDQGELALRPAVWPAVRTRSRWPRGGPRRWPQPGHVWGRRWPDVPSARAAAPIARCVDGLADEAPRRRWDRPVDQGRGGAVGE